MTGIYERETGHHTHHLLYTFGVGLLAAHAFDGFCHGLATPEMLYGPAITIVSGWIISPLLYALRRKKHDGLTRNRCWQSRNGVSCSADYVIRDDGRSYRLHQNADNSSKMEMMVW